MNYEKIENLKKAMLSLARQGSRVRIPAYGVEGRIAGIGFKPYWTGRTDTFIEKLQVDFMDNFGRVMPYNFFKIIDYDVISNDGREYETIKNASLDLHVYSNKNRGDDPVEKVRVDFFPEASK